MENFKTVLVDLDNEYFGSSNADLIKFRCQLFEKYQKIVADGVVETTDITASNFSEVHVALIGDPVKGVKDGKEYFYYAFKILPPYKFADDLNS